MTRRLLLLLIVPILTGAVVAPRLAAAPHAAVDTHGFGSNVPAAVAPARALDVDIEPLHVPSRLRRVRCAAAAPGTSCFISAA